MAAGSPPAAKKRRVSFSVHDAQGPKTTVYTPPSPGSGSPTGAPPSSPNYTTKAAQLGSISPIKGSGKKAPNPLTLEAPKAAPKETPKETPKKTPTQPFEVPTRPSKYKSPPKSMPPLDR